MLWRHATNVGMDEILPDKEQRLIEIPGQGVGEAVAEVELGGVAISLAKATIRLASNRRLASRQRFDDDAQLAQEFIKVHGVTRIWKPIGDDGRFEEGCCRHMDCGRFNQCFETFLGRGLVKEDGEDCRRIDNHLGNPSSP